MRKVRPRPLPSRSSLVICVCLLTCSSPASAFKPQPLRTPSTAAAAHGRPQTTHTRAESVDIREPVSQPWRVSTARYPLIGWPSWGPKLHEAVIVERRDANAAAAGPAYLLFDFIPVSATKISTVTTLFRGQTVPGMIREKVLTFAPPTLAFQGDSRRSLDEIRAFCAKYDEYLHLINNNCYTFSDRLQRFLIRDDDRWACASENIRASAVSQSLDVNGNVVVSGNENTFGLMKTTSSDVTVLSRINKSRGVCEIVSTGYHAKLILLGTTETKKYSFPVTNSIKDSFMRF